MDSLITVMNKLYDGLLAVDIETRMVDLPQIVVMGSQSSGKSSVLESLVGKSFLPRGIGMVTRVPLVLHIINQSEFEHKSSESKDYTQDWATFLHKPNIVFNDFGKVCKEIELRTKELADYKKNISDEPIELNVYSRCMYNLTFVDLPGLTKGSIEDQPLDMETKIRDLILHYIENPNSIILVVVTADSDPAISESLHIAKSVDPNGDRTIVVVTKIDTIIASTDAIEFLSGKIIPVKLGIIGVINRSQKDEQKTIIQSLEAEKTYFEKMYPTVADKQGTIVLGKTLAYQFTKKIKETYPDLKKQFSDMRLTNKQKLRQLIDLKTNFDRSLLNLLIRIGTSFVACLDGQLNSRSLKECNQGSEILHYYKYFLKKNIDNIKPLQGLSSVDIINVMKNTSCANDMGEFMPAIAFDFIVKKQLQMLESPLLKCVHYVHQKLMSTAVIIKNEFSEESEIDFNELEEKIINLLSMFLDKYKEDSINEITTMMNYQKSLINTNDPEFIKNVIMSKRFKTDFDKIVSSSHSIEMLQKKIDMEWESILVNIFGTFSDISELSVAAEALIDFIEHYFNVVKKTVQVMIPKIIMNKMINNIKLNFPVELISRFYNSNDPKMREWLLLSKDILDEKIRIAKHCEDASVEAADLIDRDDDSH